MAEDANGQEMRIGLTPQRIEKFRKEGKVAQSKRRGKRGAALHGASPSLSSAESSWTSFCGRPLDH